MNDTLLIKRLKKNRMTFKYLKFLLKKIVVNLIFLILIPLFIVKVGLWLVKRSYNYQEAKRELDFLRPY